MSKETKKALHEMQTANEAANALHHFGSIDINRGMHRYDSKTVTALFAADQKLKRAKISYYTLFFKEQGWTKKYIDTWLESA